VPQTVKTPIKTSPVWYSSSISSHAAPTDLAEVYQRYFKWNWLTGL
jgi:hypothetical protein